MWTICATARQDDGKYTTIRQVPTFWVRAVNEEHAKQIAREVLAAFPCPDVSFDICAVKDNFLTQEN